jgi:hypothetical protein
MFFLSAATGSLDRWRRRETERGRGDDDDNDDDDEYEMTTMRMSMSRKTIWTISLWFRNVEVHGIQ